MKSDGIVLGQRTVSDYLLARLIDEQIDTIFGVTGGGIMYLIDAITRCSEIRFIPTHHEEFAGLAADGYARASHRFGVVLGTTGPGLTHLFSPVAAAWQDSSPLLVVAGQVKSSDSTRLNRLSLRQNGTFEFDGVDAFSGITKFAECLSDPGEFPEVLESALAAMTTGRPGPALIEIPLDFQNSNLSKAAASAGHHSVDHKKQFSDQPEAQWNEFRRILRSEIPRAKRPLFLVGNGVVRSGKWLDVRRFLRHQRIPFAATQFARELGASNDPLFVGSPGLKGNRSANLAIAECDLLVCIGTSLHQQVIGWDSGLFKGLQCRRIWADVDPNVLRTRGALVDVALNVSVEDVVRALDQLATEWLPEDSDTRPDWNDRIAHLQSAHFFHFPAHADESSRFCLYRCVSELSAHADAFENVITDAGIAWYVMAQHFKCSEGSNYVSSGSFGAMGAGLPLGIGAWASNHGRTLVVTGEGSIMMCLQEIATAVSLNADLLLVIVNNGGYLSIRTTHKRYFDGRTLGTDASDGLFIPDFEELCQAFRIPYDRATSVDELRSILLDVEEWHGPRLVEVFTYTDQVVEPFVDARIDSTAGPSPRFGEMKPDVC